MLPHTPQLGVNLFLLLVSIFLSIYVIYVFLIAYHLMRFGIGVEPKRAALIFMLGATLLLFALVVTYTRIDTRKVVETLKPFLSNPVFTPESLP